MSDDRKNSNGSKEDRHVEKLRLYQAIVRDIRFTIPIIITLLGGTVYGNADTIKKLWTPPIAEGEVATSTATSAALQQSLDSFKAAITKLQDQDEAFRRMLEVTKAELAKASSDADKAQNRRLDNLDKLVQ